MTWGHLRIIPRRLHAKWTMAVTWRWRAWRNWRNGYELGVVERYRCCQHTTPRHAVNCSTRSRT